MNSIDYFPRENTELIEEKLTNKSGLILTRKYERGMMLGKVYFI